MLAIAEEGCLLNAPDVYMDKLAVGPGHSPNIVNFDNSIRQNVEAAAKEKGCTPPTSWCACSTARVTKR